MWTMVQHFLQVPDLITRISQIRTLMHPRYLPRRHKRHYYSHRKHDVGPRSASDQYSDESDQPRMSPTKPQTHADKSRYKSRSRYVPSSSAEDQPSVAKHRSSKPSGAQPTGVNSDQDQPQHDPDPPYYREVALFDIPYQYAEEVDTFRRILSLPDPRNSMPRPQLQSWVWTMRKAIKSSDLEVLPQCSHLAQLSKMPLINLNMIFRPLIYLRVNISNLLLPLQGGTALLSREISGIQILQRYVLLLNPLELLWAWFPYQFLRNWNTKLGKISQRSTLLLPLPRLHLLAMLLLKSVNIALSQPSRRLRLRSRKVPILRKLQNVDMNKPVST